MRKEVLYMKLQPKDKKQLLKMCIRDSFKTAPTYENIIEDLYRTPPGKTTDDKYFLGFFQKDQTLIAILDLIFDYPKPQVAYIGLFMMHVSEQGKGTGSKICLLYTARFQTSCRSQAHSCALMPHGS